MADAYRVADAARLLGVSPKRVRQLIEEGRLPVVAGSSPMAVEAEAVHRERERRRRTASTPGPEPTGGTVAVTVETLLDYAERVSRRAIEASDSAHGQVEELLRTALAEATARAAAAEAEAQRLREQLDRRRKRRKGKGKGKRKK